MTFLLLSLALLVVGGLLALALFRSPRAASWAGAMSCLLGGAAGSLSAGRALSGVAMGGVELGWNVLVDLDRDAALAALERPLPPGERPELYGGGHAGRRICDVLDAYTPAG